MTVREILAMLHCPEEVALAWNGDRISFDHNKKIEVEAWGDFVVSEIYATKEQGFELTLASSPVKMGA